MIIYQYPPAPAAAAPVGGATAANQVLQLAQETAIAASVASIDTKTPTVGQKASAASSPVVLSTEQEAEIGIVTETAPASDTASSGLNGRLQRIAQRISSLITLFPSSIGTKASAASLSVVIASDQAAVPTSNPDTTASGTITAINQNVAVTLAGHSTVSIQVTGVYTGALTPQVTTDGATWVAMSGIIKTDTGVTSATIASAVQGMFQAEVAGYAQFRLFAVGAITGTATVTIRASIANGLVSLDTPLPVGANIIGALTANQSVNCAQMNGVAVTMGTGISGTGVQRVTLATDIALPAGANTIGALTANQSVNLNQIAGTTTTTGAGASGAGTQRVILSSDSPSGAPSVPAAVTVKQAAITIGTTAIRLTTDAAAPSSTRRNLNFMTDSASTGNFWYGSSSVTSTGATRGIPLFPGQNIQFFNDSNDYYVISDTAAQTGYIVEAE